MEQEIQQLKNEVENLKREMSLIKSSGTFPYEIDSAIKERFKNSEFAMGSESDTLVATYTQAVDEGGAATYDVAKTMTGFITLEYNGSKYNIATYD